MKIEPGERGQYEVFVHDRSVITKTFSGFPTDEEVVTAVAKALGHG